MKTPPTLETERLILRPFTFADAPEVQRLAGEEAIAKTTLNIPHPYEDGMAEAWIKTHLERIKRGESVNFAIVLRQSRSLLGVVALNLNQAHASAELGYWIGVPYWNNGYVTEAANAVLRYGFETLDLNRIHSGYMENNPASGRVLEKTGMRYEGCLRKHLCKWNKFYDLLLYGVLSSEYESTHTV